MAGYRRTDARPQCKAVPRQVLKLPSPWLLQRPVVPPGGRNPAPKVQVIWAQMVEDHEIPGRSQRQRDQEQVELFHGQTDTDESVHVRFT